MDDLSTWQDVLDAFYGITGDTQSGGTWFSAATVESWANQVLVEMAEHADIIEKDISTVTVAGTAEYTFNTSGHATFGIKRLEVDNEKMTPTDKRQLFASNRSWATASGTPKWYYRDGLNDFDEAGLPVALWPTPGSSGVAVRAVLSVAPDAVDNDTATAEVLLPLWAVPGLLWGMLAIAYNAETRLRNLKTAQVFRSMYNDVVDRLRSRSYGRLPRSVAYASKPARGHGLDWRQRFPSDGFEV